VPGIIPGVVLTPGDPDPDSASVSIFTAVREQLSLKLTPEKGEVDVLAVAHVERPKPN